MRVSRLYLPQTLEEGAVLQLDEESAHYLRTVLRLKKGADLIVFNGDGREYSARVLTIGRDGVQVEIGTGRSRDVESPLTIHIGLGISRGERMDLAIQKAVELGVSRITPLFTEHCVVRLDEARRGSRRQHWQKVARSACEQCGRNRVPEIAEPIELRDWVVGSEGLRLFFDPQAMAGLKDLPQPEGTISILSGPEGGFAEKERILARETGFIPVRLGPRILRTETAVLAALSAIQAIWGDLG
ncbi:16S rRNA (uracil(1498)-N(3))-methyltransferase [Methylocaldum szegediense]|uniref:Ribosomal RNA small subunit methyltransferase E n=1 Tax=Methylocaldum szegediense TaxID=73780 RepID=A0ABN8X8H8_9GAMM|nr:16S rRNA (uracil(1498)-N(3))-methyltransferase [Methylocaldum szegediense]CAI8885702.1 Ribosomal RNA small subunit methyltransferase E [Methylocaldum szegediense]